MNAPVYICLSCSDLNFHLALLSTRLHSIGHLINMRNAFNYSEPRGCPGGDLRHWASSACVHSLGGIKAEAEFLISDTDYDWGFLRKAWMQYRGGREEGPSGVCCAPL